MSALQQAVFDARTTPDILAALARLIWAADYDNAECPASEIPSEDAILEWLPGVPAEALAEAVGFMRAAGFVGKMPAEDVSHGSFGRAKQGGPLVLTLWWGEQDNPAMISHTEFFALHRIWQAESKPGKHPLAAIVRAWQQRPRTGDKRRVDFVENKGLRVSKTPALGNVAYQAPLDAGEVVTVEIDREPFVSPSPVQMRSYRPQRTPGQLDAFPATIDQRATGGLLVEGIAALSLSDDERSTLRRDLRGFGEVVCALTGPIIGTAREIIEWAGWPGASSDGANVDRLARLLDAARHLRVDLGDRLPRWLFDLNALDGTLGLDTRYKIGAGPWWQGGAASGNANAWRLSGGLWRPIQGKTAPGSAGIGYWGLPDRIIAGIEAALSWGASPGKGRGGRIPEALRPVRKGGPGPERIIPAWHVLRLAGENITEESYRAKSKYRERYRNAIMTLEALGYVCTTPSQIAPAGSTIDIVKVVKGGNGRQSHLVVRASERFCAAYAQGQKGRGAWSSAPISTLKDWRQNPDATRAEP